MGFEEKAQGPEFAGDLGPGRVTVLGGNGCRLTGLSSFHLDEGPGFAWLSIYRVLGDAKELDLPRSRGPSSVSVDEGDVVVQWDPCEELDAVLRSRYRLVEEQMAVDVTFSVDARRDYSALELFVSSYFTPYFTPRYAVMDNRAHPEGVFWYEKQWYGEAENECWPRDPAGLEVIQDGRWLTGYPLNWRVGPYYALPLMTQEHRYSPAIVIMAKREDCMGMSGFYSFHNSHYLHLFGVDVAAGDRLATTVRLAVLRERDKLDEAAVQAYEDWIKEGTG